ncbi:hypothetical protein ACGFY9_46235 [Streptomyces sp. NPDC048504]
MAGVETGEHEPRIEVVATPNPIAGGTNNSPAGELAMPHATCR